jgi:hypothetical protein
MGEKLSVMKAWGLNQITPSIVQEPIRAVKQAKVDSREYSLLIQTLSKL